MASVFVILDGFDECAEDLQEFVIRLTDELAELSVRILVTSRQHIQTFQRLQPTVLTIGADPSDIQNFLNDRLKHIRTVSLRDRIIKKLTEGENEM
jgi:hypothetical protein